MCRSPFGGSERESYCSPFKVGFFFILKNANCLPRERAARPRVGWCLGGESVFSQVRKTPDCAGSSPCLQMRIVCPVPAVGIFFVLGYGSDRGDRSERRPRRVLPAPRGKRWSVTTCVCVCVRACVCVCVCVCITPLAYQRYTHTHTHTHTHKHTHNANLTLALHACARVSRPHTLAFVRLLHRSRGPGIARVPVQHPSLEGVREPESAPRAAHFARTGCGSNGSWNLYYGEPVDDVHQHTGA